jgi:hypothetical protein
MHISRYVPVKGCAGPSGYLILMLALPYALPAQPAPECLKISVDGQKSTWQNTCTEPISVGYCSADKPIWGKLCGTTGGKKNPYYTHMKNLNAGETSSQAAGYRVAPCRGFINSWDLQGRFISDATGRYDCFGAAPVSKPPARTQCEALVKYRDTELSSDLARGLKNYSGAKRSLALLTQVRQEAANLRARQPGVQAAYQLTLGMKTTADAISGILKLDARTRVALGAAKSAGDWSARILNAAQGTSIITALANDSLVEHVVKEAVENSSGFGSALASAYEFVDNLKEHKEVYTQGAEILDVLDSSLAGLERNLRQLDGRLASSTFLLEAVNRRKNEIDKACH